MTDMGFSWVQVSAVVLVMATTTKDSWFGRSTGRTSTTTTATPSNRTASVPQQDVRCVVLCC